MSNQSQIATKPSARPSATKNGKGWSRKQIAVAISVGGLLLAAIIVVLVLTRSSGAVISEAETAIVRRGELKITISEGGVLQAERMERVRSLVQDRIAIIDMVPEGCTITEEDVKNGKVLVELDSASLRDRCQKQEVTVQNNNADLIKAREDLKIQELQSESDINQAELNAKFSVTDLAGYLGEELAASVNDDTDFSKIGESPILKGLALQKMTQLLNQQRLDEQSAVLADATYEWTKKLFDKGFETKNTLEADELSAKSRKAQAEQDRLGVEVFLKYELPKQAETLYAAVREKTLELNRVKAKCNAAHAQAEQKLRSVEAANESETKRLDDFKRQIELCTIKATKPGLVIYASSTDFRRGTRQPIEAGVTVYERQEIINMPDLSSMVALIKVHESQVKRIRKGQPVEITVDAYPGLLLRGTVKDVAPLPDPPQWSQDIKVFTTTVAIEGDHRDLKPGVSCRATITISTVADTLFVPVQCVTPNNDNKVCHLVTSGGIEPRNVTTGDFDDKFVQITNGLNVGDRVLLSPPLMASKEEKKQKEPKSPDVASPGPSPDRSRQDMNAGGPPSSDGNGDTPRPQRSGKGRGGRSRGAAGDESKGAATPPAEGTGR
jgi:HlyD family secretion protein